MHLTHVMLSNNRAAARTLKVIKQESVELILHVNVHRFTLWINSEFMEQ